MLAHELRNPLAPILSAVQLMRMKPVADPQLSWSRDVIERQLSHLTRLVDRSEEHTSELQSRLHLVCRLLLEKKKKHSPHALLTFHIIHTITTTHALTPI